MASNWQTALKEKLNCNFLGDLEKFAAASALDIAALEMHTLKQHAVLPGERYMAGYAFFFLSHFCIVLSASFLVSSLCPHGHSAALGLWALCYHVGVGEHMVHCLVVGLESCR